MARTTYQLRSNQKGQAIAEYAVLLVVILMIIVGTVRLVGQRAHSTFSDVVNTFRAEPPRGD